MFSRLTQTVGTTHVSTWITGICLLLVITSTGFAQSLEPGMYAEIETSRGTILIDLAFDKAPLTVANFVGLAEGNLDPNVRDNQPFYNGLTFHRVVANFMIQGGDPTGTGRGGPGYLLPDEFHPDLKHDRAGTVSMANAGPDTNGSQFFITHEPTPWLDDKHAVFGYVIEGQNIVNAIQEGDTITNLRIIRVGEAAENFVSSPAIINDLKEQVLAARTQQLQDTYRDELLTIQEQFPNAQSTDSGLQYVIVREGTGNTPPSGAVVTVHYIAQFLDGRVFDSSIDRSEPIQFPVGVGKTIPGFDEGLLNMKRGEERILIIPPELAYGSRGAGDIVPPNSFLVFDVHLLDF